jgi:TRAP-type transport system periplasmic protein
LSEMKGWKIRTWGFMTPKVVQAIGAVPVSIPAVETHDAMSKGVAQGTIATLETAHRYGYIETAKYWNESLAQVIPILPPSYVIMANLDMFNKLPKDIQDIFVKVGEDATVWYNTKLVANAATYKKDLIKRGLIYYKVPDAEIQEVRRQAGKATEDAYIEKCEKMGYTRIREIIAKDKELWRAVK